MFPRIERLMKRNDGPSAARAEKGELMKPLHRIEGYLMALECDREALLPANGMATEIRKGSRIVARQPKDQGNVRSDKPRALWFIHGTEMRKDLLHWRGQSGDRDHIQHDWILPTHDAGRAIRLSGNPGQISHADPVPQVPVSCGDGPM